MNNIRVRSGNRLLPWLMLSVSLAGFSLFYLFPFAASFFYTVVDAPVRGHFADCKITGNYFRTNIS